MIKIIFLITYIVLVVLIQIFIEIRLKTILKRHHDKVEGGYGSYGIYLLYRRQRVVIYFFTIILFSLNIMLIITLL
ncbi:hypothetical protein KAZ01_01200 [Candidatus Gracilibacteria bacterium]|nr:hypothetical protein [Candidatus Gracilibacteria bacterium]